MVMARGKKGSEQTVAKSVALIELKNHILQTLHKLSDRDTQQLAVEELERIAQNLTPKGIALFVACLHDTDAQFKSVVRRDCIRLVGTLAAIHGDLLACHLPKMVGNIIRRLKDPDYIIREACVETIGILASQIGVADPQSATNVFIKPLLEALTEKHENLQMGASMCLAEVIKSIKDPHLLTLQRLCPQVVKMLASPNFLAKALLLNAIGVMVQVPGVFSLSQLSVLLSFAQEELSNSEWPIRKAAADILSFMATIASSALGSYREGVLIALENTRFDKVKHVRDSVCEALHLWKSIYHTNGLHGAQTSKSHKSRSPTGIFDGDATQPLNDLKNSLLMRFGISVNSSFYNTSERLKSMLNKHANTLKSKTLVHINKKENPEFFQKVEGVKDSIDWQVGIAPRHDSPHGRSPRVCGVSSENPVLQHDSPHGESPRVCKVASENPLCHSNCMATLPRSGLLCNDSCETLYPQGDEGVDFQYDQNKVGQFNQPIENGEIANFVTQIGDNGYQDPRPNEPLEYTVKWEDPQSHANDGYVPQGDANVTSMNDVDKASIDMVSIHQHFHNLEHQQLSIMEMLQESMVHVQESLQSLEERMSRLELVVGDNTAQGSSNPDDGRCSTIDESQSLPCRHAHENYLSNDFFEGRESEEFAAIPSSPRTQNSLESTCGDSDEFTFIRTGHPGGHSHALMAETVLNPPGVLDSSSLQQVPEDETLPEEFLAEQAAEATRIYDQEHGGLRIPPQGQVGSSNSIRSVWHASKAEAIAAIRGAATPSNYNKIYGNHHRNSKQQHSYRDFNIDQKPHDRYRVAPPPPGGGPFWMLWSRAMESVQSRNFDVAYSEILGSKDELLLVRLMGYTGPVWEQLGTATVSQLLVCIQQFLQQQSFLDCIVPWLQQVSDLVSSKGPKALGLTGETKNLVFALQNAASMDYTQSSMGTKVTELAEQLRNAWSSGNSRRCKWQVRSHYC